MQGFPKSKHIPRATIQRLAIYVQLLESLAHDGEKIISSEGLASACGVNPSQIRKDLAYFGEFGVRGVGYYVSDLLTAIRQALGVDRTWNVALVGVGNLGRALLRHSMLRKRGFMLVAAFDCDPFKIGEDVGGMEILCTRRLKEKVEECRIEIGIITTPPERAQRAANYLVDAGILGIINFATTRIDVPGFVAVEYVDFIHHMFSVAFTISSNVARGVISST
ncbi:MAG: redox-sensing transcriptional repressor Rex [Deltaproteobacteria bacterium]|nr:redox-sensing transcriptional repressor Rex [Deltaproteobacteria bacterium]